MAKKRKPKKQTSGDSPTGSADFSGYSASDSSQISLPESSDPVGASSDPAMISSDPAVFCPDLATEGISPPKETSSATNIVPAAHCDVVASQAANCVTSTIIATTVLESGEIPTAIPTATPSDVPVSPPHETPLSPPPLLCPPPSPSMAKKRKPKKQTSGDSPTGSADFSGYSASDSSQISPPESSDPVGASSDPAMISSDPAVFCPDLATEGISPPKETSSATNIVSSAHCDIVASQAANCVTSTIIATTVLESGEIPTSIPTATLSDVPVSPPHETPLSPPVDKAQAPASSSLINIVKAQAFLWRDKVKANTGKLDPEEMP
ncbi:hypothetical protein F2Q69_00020787 [Brassica cretica]|uniref:Uncharacterized protein n=1 Tax=Brassica cretica TaxID=69181 RepID=A0A8S9Q116_BRACR|nr:hypothetical protein F2Q69_00020787 [Brassica cretica]